MKNLPSDKTTVGQIPVSVLKSNDFYFSKLTKCINKTFANKKFPETLKHSDITPIYKKLHSCDKANYRPVSTLPLVPKIFGKIIYEQLYEYIENFLNKSLYGFPKTHSLWHALFRSLQQWQSELDSGEFVGTRPMDLSNACDCLLHNILIAK